MYLGTFSFARVFNVSFSVTAVLEFSVCSRSSMFGSLSSVRSNCEFVASKNAFYIISKQVLPFQGDVNLDLFWCDSASHCE